MTCLIKSTNNYSRDYILLQGAWLVPIRPFCLKLRCGTKKFKRRASHSVLMSAGFVVEAATMGEQETDISVSHSYRAYAHYARKKNVRNRKMLQVLPEPL